MIRLNRKASSIDAVACSGGPDSMALLHFLNRARFVDNPIKACYFNHGTKHADKAEAFVRDYCKDNKLPFKIGYAKRPKEKGESWEEYWRNSRYSWMFNQPFTIATAHHLDDVVETFMLGIIRHGYPRRIQEKMCNILRPILLTPKNELMGWIDRYGVPYIEDPSNEETRYSRNRLRHNILPELYKINPGFAKVVRRLYDDS